MALNMFVVMVSDGHSIVDACNLAGRCTGFNPDVVYRWARAVFRDFLGAVSNIDDVDDQSLETELVSSKGRHPKWESLINDEGFVLEATAYVREHGYVKEAPNLTLADFVQWLKDKLCVEVCTEIARQWLLKMGFSYQQFSKGVYFDGHERADVVLHRSQYLASLDDRMLVSPLQYPLPASNIPAVIRVYHDESTFHANSDQSYYWSDGSNKALKQT